MHNCIIDTGPSVFNMLLNILVFVSKVGSGNAREFMKKIANTSIILHFIHQSKALVRLYWFFCCDFFFFLNLCSGNF